MTPEQLQAILDSLPLRTFLMAGYVDADGTLVKAALPIDMFSNGEAYGRLLLENFAAAENVTGATAQERLQGSLQVLVDKKIRPRAQGYAMQQVAQAASDAEQSADKWTLQP